LLCGLFRDKFGEKLLSAGDILRTNGFRACFEAQIRSKLQEAPKLHKMLSYARKYARELASEGKFSAYDIPTKA